MYQKKGLEKIHPNLKTYIPCVLRKKTTKIKKVIYASVSRLLFSWNRERYPPQWIKGKMDCM